MIDRRRDARQLFPLDWGLYSLLDGVIYQGSHEKPSRKDAVVLASLEDAERRMTREISLSAYRPTWINPSAVLVDESVLVMGVNGDGSVTVGFTTYPRKWPEERSLGRMGDPERGGGGFWTVTVEVSELSDINDGVPDEWRAFLPR